MHDEFMPHTVMPVKKSERLITPKLVAQIVAQRRGGLADLALAGLRFARDETPDEWDALMKTKSGPVLSKLWDILRDASEEADK